MARDKAKAAEYGRKWRAANREKLLRDKKDWYAKRGGRAVVDLARHGSPEERRRVWREQRLKSLEKLAGRPCPEVCDACGKPSADKRRLHFDHDHETQEFRGWLCSKCNTALGLADDSPETLLQLALYLERSRKSKC